MEHNRSDENKQSSGKRQASGAAVLQPAVTEALQRAFFEEWAARGYSALSLERVASRAGVGKAALYRRWPSKLVLASDALQAIGVTITLAPDTGSLEGDVRALLSSLRKVLRHPLVRRIVPDLQAENARSPELRAVVTRLTGDRRARGAAIIEQAVARGELGVSVDRELAADLLAAPIYWRIVITRGISDDFYLHRLTAALIAGLKAC